MSRIPFASLDSASSYSVSDKNYLPVILVISNTTKKDMKTVRKAICEAHYCVWCST